MLRFLSISLSLALSFLVAGLCFVPSSAQAQYYFEGMSGARYNFLSRPDPITVNPFQPRISHTATVERITSQNIKHYRNISKTVPNNLFKDVVLRCLRSRICRSGGAGIALMGIFGAAEWVFMNGELLKGNQLHEWDPVPGTYTYWHNVYVCPPDVECLIVLSSDISGTPRVSSHNGPSCTVGGSHHEWLQFSSVVGPATWRDVGNKIKLGFEAMGGCYLEHAPLFDKSICHRLGGTPDCREDQTWSDIELSPVLNEDGSIYRVFRMHWIDEEKNWFFNQDFRTFVFIPYGDLIAVTADELAGLQSWDEVDSRWLAHIFETEGYPDPEALGYTPDDIAQLFGDEADTPWLFDDGGNWVYDEDGNRIDIEPPAGTDEEGEIDGIAPEIENEWQAPVIGGECPQSLGEIPLPFPFSGVFEYDTRFLCDAGQHVRPMVKIIALIASMVIIIRGLR